MSTYTPITSAELLKNAKIGGEELKAYILGGAALSRTERTKRANDALWMLRNEMKKEPVEMRRAVIEVTRAVLQGNLEEIRAEIVSAKADKRAALEAELTDVDRKKQAVLQDERVDATPTEYVQAEMREIIDENVNGDWTTWLKTGGIVAGAGIAAHWVWDHTFGALFQWFRGKDAQPGFFESAAKWLATAGAAIGGLLGIRSMMRTKAGDVIRAAADVGTGAGDQLKETGEVFGGALSKDLDYWVRIFTSGDWKKSLEIVRDESLPLFFENGKAFVWVLGKAIEMPGLSLAKTVEWFRSGKQPEDYWIIWGASGVAYVVGKAAFNLVINGKLDLPKSKGDVAMTVARLAAGPIEATWDALYTTGRLVTADGRRTLRILSSQSNPGTAISWFTQPNLRSQESILAAIDDWKGYQSDAEFMRSNMGDNDVWTKEEVETADKYVAQRLSSIRKALADQDPLATDPMHLRALKLAAKRRGPDADFADAINVYREKEAYAVADEQAKAEAKKKADQAADAEKAEKQKTDAEQTDTTTAAPTAASQGVSADVSGPAVAPVAAVPDAPVDVQGEAFALLESHLSDIGATVTELSRGTGRMKTEQLQAKAETIRKTAAILDAQVAAIESAHGRSFESRSLRLRLRDIAERFNQLRIMDDAYRIDLGSMPDAAVEADAELRLAPIDTSLRRPTVATAIPEVPVAPDVEKGPSVAPSPVNSRRAIGSDGASQLPMSGSGPNDGDAGGPVRSRARPPKPLAPMAVETRARFEIPQAELDERLANPARATEFLPGADASLLDADAAGSQADASSIRAPSVDPASISDAAAQIRSSVRADAETNSDGSTKSSPKGGRR